MQSEAAEIETEVPYIVNLIVGFEQPNIHFKKIQIVLITADFNLLIANQNGLYPQRRIDKIFTKSTV